MHVHIHDSARNQCEEGSLIEVSQFYADLREAIAWASDKLQEGFGNFAFIQGWLDNRATLVRHSDNFVYLLAINPIFVDVIGLAILDNDRTTCAQKSIADIYDYTDAHDWAKHVLQMKGISLALLTSPQGVVAAWQLNQDNNLELIAFGEAKAMSLL